MGLTGTCMECLGCLSSRLAESATWPVPTAHTRRLAPEQMARLSFTHNRREKHIQEMNKILFFLLTKHVWPQEMLKLHSGGPRATIASSRQKWFSLPHTRRREGRVCVRALVQTRLHAHVCLRAWSCNNSQAPWEGSQWLDFLFQCILAFKIITRKQRRRLSWFYIKRKQVEIYLFVFGDILAPEKWYHSSWLLGQLTLGGAHHKLLFLQDFHKSCQKMSDSEQMVASFGSEHLVFFPCLHDGKQTHFWWMFVYSLSFTV